MSPNKIIHKTVKKYFHTTTFVTLGNDSIQQSILIFDTNTHEFCSLSQIEWVFRPVE
jgi:hypothetical protein